MSHRLAYSGISTGHAGAHAIPEPCRRSHDQTAPSDGALAQVIRPGFFMGLLRRSGPPCVDDRAVRCEHFANSLTPLGLQFYEPPFLHRAPFIGVGAPLGECGATATRLMPLGGIDTTLARWMREVAANPGQVQVCQGDVTIRINDDGNFTVTPENAVPCGFRRGYQSLQAILSGRAG